MTAKKSLLFVFVLLVYTASVFAQHPVIDLDDERVEYRHVGKSMYVFEDKQHKYDFEEIRQKDELFKKSNLDAPNFGTTNSMVWSMLDIRLKTSRSWYLEFDAPWLDTLIVYYPEKGVYKTHMLGRRLPLRNQPHAPDLLYRISPIDFPADTVLRFYFRANARVVVLPVFVGRSDEVMDIQHDKELLYVFYSGIVFILALFYFAVFITSRKRENLYYVLWLIASTYYFALTKGILKLFLPGDLQYLVHHSVEPAIFAGLMLLFFTRNSLRIKELLPKFRIWLDVLLGAMIIDLLMCFVGQDRLALKIFEPLMILSMIASLVAGVLVYVKGKGYAFFYMLAFGQTLVNVSIYILVFMKVLHFNSYTSNASLVATLLETALLSLGLGAKIRYNENEKQKAQEISILAMQENEKIIREQNELLEIKVSERTQQLELEKGKSEDLLRNILPANVADELKQNGFSEARHYDHVTVLFTDFVNFTGIAENLPPKELVMEIDRYFMAFDEIIEKREQKIKTIGDAYLAVCGVPNIDQRHAVKAVNAAKEIVAFVKQRKQEGGLFDIRIGLNSGPVVAGIVGSKKFAYDIWGDTVNMSSRMQTSSDPGKINISGATYELIKNDFSCSYRGKVEVKNKGMIDMYFVE